MSKEKEGGRKSPGRPNSGASMLDSCGVDAMVIPPSSNNDGLDDRCGEVLSCFVSSILTSINVRQPVGSSGHSYMDDSTDRGFIGVTKHSNPTVDLAKKVD